MALALLATPAAAATPDAALARAEQVGRLIYDHDQAAWYGADEMGRAVSDLPKSGGWIVEPHDGLLRVTFFGDDSGAPRVFFWADMRGQSVVASHVVAPTEDVGLTPGQARMAQARHIALGQGKSPCTKAAFNTVVLPPESEASPVSVYLLTAMTQTGVYPLGGDYRVDVGGDGQVVGGRDFTKSCFNLDTTAAPPGAVAGITHLLDPYPTEIHVFVSLWMGKPLYVMTGPKTVWVVDQGTIRRAKGR